MFWLQAKTLKCYLFESLFEFDFRAEVDKILSKDRDNSEANQQMQYKIDCLETELFKAKQVNKTN